MKILSGKQIREADNFTIQNEPISSIDLMERAADAAFRRILQLYQKIEEIIIFCGPGNNGGDGLAIARMFLESGISGEVFILDSSRKYSPDNIINLERLKSTGNNPVIIKSNNDFPQIGKSTLVVDALFGTGLDRPLIGIDSDLVKHINGSGSEIVSIDMPSGLFCEDNYGNDYDSIINATVTITFQLPKLSLFFAENNRFTGRWEIVSIGLSANFIAQAVTQYFLTDYKYASSVIKIRNKFSHKGLFGHCLLLSGSYGKMGAAILSSKAALKTGAGLVTVHAPKVGVKIVQTAVPEAMVSAGRGKKIISDLPLTDQFNAIGAGPGTGVNQKTANTFLTLIKTTKVPLVLDADALNILAANPGWIEFIPKNSILTPHPGEFDRIAGKHKSGFQRLSSQKKFAKRYNLVIVLKGAYSSVVLPNGDCYFNSTGNPGMATAGSGDVLTGIILSLLGQKYHQSDAAIFGTFLHGLAGDLATGSQSEESVVAGDIINNIGNAYAKIKLRL